MALKRPSGTFPREAWERVGTRGSVSCPRTTKSSGNVTGRKYFVYMVVNTTVETAGRCEPSDANDVSTTGWDNNLLKQSENAENTYKGAVANGLTARDVRKLDPVALGDLQFEV